MTNTNSSTGVDTRCQFLFSDGRNCRMLRSPDHSSFCAFHPWCHVVPAVSNGTIYLEENRV